VSRIGVPESVNPFDSRRFLATVHSGR
jgi:hypothetical protein